MEYREDTNDWNTLTASISEDEYQLRYLELSGHALDIGGYLGSVGISLAIDQPGLTVTIVEPVPDNVDLIRTNVALNGLGERVEVIHGAVGPKSLKTTTIHYGFRGSETATHHAFVGNASLLTLDQIGPKNCPSLMPHDHFEAKVYPLAKLLPADFIKIDCEGGEWTFMADAPTTKIARWVGEMHPIPEHVEGAAGQPAGGVRGDAAWLFVQVGRPADWRRCGVLGGAAMNIVLMLAHSIEQYDQIKLLTGLGYDVFAFNDPTQPLDDKRPGIPGAPVHQDLLDACHEMRVKHDHIETAQLPQYPVDWAKADLPQEVLDWADVIICHHFEHTWIVPQWQRLRDSGKRVIWRTVGQSVDGNERMMAPLHAEGMEIVRYSPKERNIPGYAGEDALIRFYKDPSEWYGWTGQDPVVINITQNLKQRDPYTNWQFWEAATVGLPRVALGPGSEAIGGSGPLEFDEMKKLLRHARAYLYTGTQPASYTLGLIEAMMTGTPIVSISADYMNVFPFGRDLFEGDDLVRPWAVGDLEGIDLVRAQLKMLLDYPAVAHERSNQMRKRAVALFGIQPVARAGATTSATRRPSSPRWPRRRRELPSLRQSDLPAVGAPRPRWRVRLIAALRRTGLTMRPLPRLRRVVWARNTDEAVAALGGWRANVLADRHHGGLFQSIQLLGKRLDWTVYTPTGHGWWDEEVWQFGKGYGDDRLAQQFLMPEETEQYDPEFPDTLIRGVTLEQARTMEWAVVMATVQDNQRGFAKFAKETGAKFAVHVGNTNQVIEWDLDPAVLNASEMYGGIHIGEEFDSDGLFAFAEPTNIRHVSSFVNCMPQIACYPLLERAQAELDISVHGINGPEGNLKPISAVAEAMRNSGWGWHDKEHGDGYGHVLHYWAAVGRPLIGHGSHYKPKMGNVYWRDLETCIDLDKHPIEQAIEMVREITPERHAEMCRAIRADLRRRDGLAGRRRTRTELPRVTRVLFLGDLAATGFGTVTQNLGRRLLDLGLDVRFSLLEEGQMLADVPEPFKSRTALSGIPGGWLDPYHPDARMRFAGMFTGGLFEDGWTPDVGIVTADMGSFEMSPILGFLPPGFPLLHYVPIEGIALPPMWRDVWAKVIPVAMCRFGAQEIAKVTGHLPPVVYHGVDSETFHPVSATHPNPGGWREEGAAIPRGLPEDVRL